MQDFLACSLPSIFSAVPELSVIVCAHNPREDYFLRTFSALAAQTLPQEQWELLVIDNKSEPPLAERVDPAPFANARIIVEEELGLTPARLRGIAEATGEVIVFVDDDNVLAPDYLEQARRIAQERPEIGAWGGLITQVFETEPPEWTRPYHVLLGYQDFDHDQWGRRRNTYIATPCGAGMCLRAEVARQWAKNVREDPFRKALGRKGNDLTSGEDTDLAWTAHDCGLGTGFFGALKLDHLIPAKRLDKDYLVRLKEMLAYAGHLLPRIRDPHHHVSLPSRLDRLVTRYKRWRYLSPIQREFELADERARERAASTLSEINRNTGNRAG